MGKGVEIKIYRGLKKRFLNGEGMKIKVNGVVVFRERRRYNGLLEGSPFVRRDRIVKLPKQHEYLSSLITELGSYFLEY